MKFDDWDTFTVYVVTKFHKNPIKNTTYRTNEFVFPKDVNIYIIL